MIKFIANAYKWFWYDFLCRKEPFTWQFRRHLDKWWGFWVVVYGLSTIYATWSFGQATHKFVFIFVYGTISTILAWLVAHLAKWDE